MFLSPVLSEYQEVSVTTLTVMTPVEKDPGRDTKVARALRVAAKDPGREAKVVRAPRVAERDPGKVPSHTAREVVRAAIRPVAVVERDPERGTRAVRAPRAEEKGTKARAPRAAERDPGKVPSHTAREVVRAAIHQVAVVERDPGRDTKVVRAPRVEERDTRAARVEERDIRAARVVEKDTKTRKIGKV